MAEAYLVAAARTAGGKRGGALKDWHPADLGAAVLDALVERSGIDPASVEDVIAGCVSQVGEQSFHIGRNMVMASKLPDSVPAVSIDRQCGSSQQALHFAAQAVMSGTQDVVIAAGVEHMTRVPMGTPVFLPMQAGIGTGPWSQAIKDRYGVTEFSQFIGAEMIARNYQMSREELDGFALESHRRAAAATERGDFADEIVPLEVVDAEGSETRHTRDEGIRFDASPEGFASLKMLKPDGVVTAGNASQICDGASGVLVVSERALKDHGLTPLARVDNLTVTAGDPVIMLMEPIPATRRALERSGRRIGDIDLYEVNEAFAPVPLAWLRELGGDPERLNVNGGAIALGHPLGASGTKLMTTLLHALEARDKRFGLQTMCEGGGIANVTIVESLH
ncbi:MAG: 3-ketoacyl-CoA thiolase @ Acetyl-CoA acetyltransferase [uncultured Sphingomonas sp.]|uniref:3-ketoacyl-CoA thiolase @ Acetyl-CoA acetyltransferase n=1 Tax=uncultured Sphingomonas sp. TaxID=158754 RepID=A0A6J4SXV2_9SPHN|nr:acetyl-CoA C-acetyltransferase [uncultured Sphingomonas sp.]CAA9508667.1 MAG: 3-ketoacyl-CoA thiolase @ Acetyl-CoA acetyltransferase [uncultured Sphingomonas sp.]